MFHFTLLHIGTMKDMAQGREIGRENGTYHTAVAAVRCCLVQQYRCSSSKEPNFYINIRMYMGTPLHMRKTCFHINAK